MQDEINQIKQDILDLNAAINKDRFSDYDAYNKYADFRYRLKLPVYASDPTSGSVGELVVVSTAVKHCTATTPTWKTFLDTDGSGASLTGITLSNIQNSYVAGETINAPLAARLVADVYNFVSNATAGTEQQVFGGTLSDGVNDNVALSQPFTIPTGGATVNQAIFSIKKNGSPVDNVILRLQGVGGGGEPDGSTVVSATIDGATVTGTFANRTFTFAATALAAANYQMVIARSGARDTSNYYIIEQKNTGSDGWKNMAGGWTTTGQFVGSVSFNDGTAGQIKIAKSDNPFNAKVFGFVPTNIASAATGVVIHFGVCTGFAGLTIGRTYYLQSDGTINTTAGTVSVKVGYALSATSLFVLLTPS